MWNNSDYSRAEPEIIGFVSKNVHFYQLIRELCDCCITWLRQPITVTGNVLEDKDAARERASPRVLDNSTACRPKQTLSRCSTHGQRSSLWNKYFFCILAHTEIVHWTTSISAYITILHVYFEYHHYSNNVTQYSLGLHYTHLHMHSCVFLNNI